MESDGNLREREEARFAGFLFLLGVGFWPMPGMGINS
jgi:hypothetical protein